MSFKARRIVFAVVGLAVVIGVLLMMWRFDADMQLARDLAAQGSVLLPTR